MNEKELMLVLLQRISEECDPHQLFLLFLFAVPLVCQNIFILCSCKH